LSISVTDENDYCMRHVKYMELIVYQMLNDGKLFQRKHIFIFLYYKSFLGHRFERPEYIMANLQQGIW